MVLSALLMVAVVLTRFYLRDHPMRIEECTVLEGSSEVGRRRPVCFACRCLHVYMHVDLASQLSLSC
jgi:hypothetical protein